MCIWLIWGWIDVEARRVLTSRLFLFVLAGLVILNCFFFLYQQSRESAVDASVYHSTLDTLSQGSWEDALAWCVQYQQDAQVTMAKGEWDYDGDEEKLRLAAIQLQSQYEHLLGYEGYLDKIDSNAKLLQTVSLFSNPDTVAYQNTVKTAQDFQSMRGKTVTAGHDLAVTSFFSDKWTDYSILIVICVICGLFMLQRREGLWSMIHAASGGRWRLAVKRVGILLAGSWIGAFVLIGARILLCGATYHGLGEWGRTLQSIPMFQNVPTPMTVGQFWLLYIGVKAMGAFWFGLVLWTMLSAISNIGLAIFASSVVIGVEFACTAIPSSSIYAMWRYVNIFSYVDFSTVFTRYLNLSVFNTLISGSDLVLAMLLPLCLVFAGLIVFIEEKKRPVAAMNPLLRLMDKVRRVADPLLAGGGEGRKLLIKRRGIFLLILVVLLAQGMEAPPREYVLWDPYVRFYQEQYAGPITEEKLELMRNNLEICSDPNNRAGLTIVLEDAMAAPEGAWIVPEAPYGAIWSNNNKNYHRTTALTVMLLLVLLVAPIASQERQNDMTVLLRSTSGGRKRLMLRKQLLLLGLATFIWALIYGTELYRTVEEYGAFTCLGAPAFSLSMVSKLSIPIGWLIGLYYFWKLVVMLALGEVCFFLSSRCTKNRNAILLCIGVLLIPAALAAIGSTIGETLSFLLPLGGVEIFFY